MSTRAIVNFMDDGPLCTAYQHNDGYPSVFGEALKTAVIAAHGASELGCLAAQVIAKLKTGPRDFYIIKAGTSDLWEEYTYDVYARDGGWWITCTGKRKGVIFDGPAAEFDTTED